MGEPEVPPILDVDRIVEDLQERVAARQSGQGYDDATLRAPFELVEGVITLRPELAFSSKPIIGTPLTRLKQVVVRLQIHFLNDMITQMNAALAATRARLEAESRHRVDLEKRLDALEARLSSPSEATIVGSRRSVEPDSASPLDPN